MHLDLSQCGLSGTMILEIAKAIKVSVTLIGIHFTGNPGVTVEIKERLFRRLKATSEQ